MMDDASRRRMDDVAQAAPSDGEVRTVWLLYSTFSALVTAFVLVVFLGILSSSKVRRISFNLYLLFLMAPDMFFGTMCAMTCAVNAAAGKYVSASMCWFQSWYVIFGLATNAWLNGVIARQVHRMLRCSYRRQRYHPPSNAEVTRHAVAVYLYATVLGVVTLFGFLWLHQDDLGDDFEYAVICIPVATHSSLFFYLAFFPAFMGLPIVYVLWVWFDVWKNGLIPRGGRTRMISIYFFRLIAVFVIMWIPSLTLIYFVGEKNVVLTWAGGLWGHLQPLVSAGVSLMKSDIKNAVLDFVCCGRQDNSDGGDSSRVLSPFNSWRENKAGSTIGQDGSSKVDDENALNGPPDQLSNSGEDRNQDDSSSADAQNCRYAGDCVTLCLSDNENVESLDDVATKGISSEGIKAEPSNLQSGDVEDGSTTVQCLSVEDVGDRQNVYT